MSYFIKKVVICCLKQYFKIQPERGSIKLFFVSFACFLFSKQRHDKIIAPGIQAPLFLQGASSQGVVIASVESGGNK